MAIFCRRSSTSFETDQNTAFNMPTSSHGSTDQLRENPIDIDGGNGKASWGSLFAFTQRQHTGTIVVALIATLISALLKPASAIFFGKIFSVLTKFGSGTLTGQETVDGIKGWCIALVALGGVAWISEGAFLNSWMVFGELQAKSVREQMFVGMLNKEMEWYDLRQDGIGSLLIRIQTFVSFPYFFTLTMLTQQVKSESSSLQYPNPWAF